MTGKVYYLSKEGREKFKKELERLKKIRARKVKGEVPNVLHSEEVNPEYVSFQEDINVLESKIAEISAILKNCQLIVLPSLEKRDSVLLGAVVAVKVDGRADEFKIVGSLEANPSVGKISDESPVGKALMGKKIGDKVMISFPIHITYKIVNIEYKR